MRRAALLVICFLLPVPLLGGQAPLKPPGNADCLACHDATATRPNGQSMALDAKRFEASTHGPLACVDCHADLAKLTEFPHADKLAKVECGSCHDDIRSKYRDSIHAYGKEVVGLSVAPACADCNAKHTIKPHTDVTSRVYHTRISETCGSCHNGIKDHFDTSIHAVALKKGDAKGPSRADTHKWRLDVTAECGSCHAQVVDSFRRTFHGKVTELGFSRVAACADCHG